jgi:predicted acyltransferase
MKKRFEDLDILRGLSVIGMILVLMPGAWEHRYSWLNHADWAGLPPLADLIFPTFLFCVGFSIPISFENRIKVNSNSSKILIHILYRTILLIAIGLFLNAFPTFDFKNLRIPGVLQRIALCWFIVTLLFFIATKIKSKDTVKLQLSLLSVIAFVILVGYWIILYFIPVPGFETSSFDSVACWPAFIDRAVFGINHLWPYGTTNGVVTYDPEGILATFPACVNVIAGTLFGLLYISQHKYLNWKIMMVSAAVLMLSSTFLHYSDLVPIIKKIWTSSFALFSTGFSIFLLAIISIIIKFRYTSQLFFPVKVFGANALSVFIIVLILQPLMDIPTFDSNGEILSFRTKGFQVISLLISNPQYASFLYTLIFLILLYAVLYLCYKKNWYLKV